MSMSVAFEGTFGYDVALDGYDFNEKVKRFDKESAVKDQADENVFSHLSKSDIPLDLPKSIFEHARRVPALDYSPEEGSGRFLSDVSKREAYSAKEKAATTLFCKANGIKSLDDSTGGSASGTVGIKADWGDGKGIQYNGYVKAEIKDSEGNSAQITIQQSTDGKGSLDASATGKKDFKQPGV